MDSRSYIAQSFRSMRSKGDGCRLFTAKVTNVNGNTCTVYYDGLEVSDVLLSATKSSEENKILLTPAIGSYVLVGSLTGTLSNLSVLRMDVVDKIEIVSNGVSFKEQLDGLLDQLTQAKILTPAGVGSFSPGDIQRFIKIKQNIAKILK